MIDGGIIDVSPRSDRAADSSAAYCPIARPSRLSCCATVIIEEPAEPRTSANATDVVRRRCASDQCVLNPMVIPLMVVVLDVLRNRAAKVAFAEWDHAIQTLVL